MIFKGLYMDQITCWDEKNLTINVRMVLVKFMMIIWGGCMINMVNPLISSITMETIWGWLVVGQTDKPHNLTKSLPL